MVIHTCNLSDQARLCLKTNPQRNKYMCMSYMYDWCLWKSEEQGMKYSEIGVTDGCKSLCGSWEPNPGRTAEQSQSPCLLFTYLLVKDLCLCLWTHAQVSTSDVLCYSAYYSFVVRPSLNMTAVFLARLEARTCSCLELGVHHVHNAPRIILTLVLMTACWVICKRASFKKLLLCLIQYVWWRSQNNFWESSFIFLGRYFVVSVALRDSRLSWPLSVLSLLPILQ